MSEDGTGAGRDHDGNVALPDAALSMVLGYTRRTDRRPLDLTDPALK